MLRLPETEAPATAPTELDAMEPYALGVLHAAGRTVPRDLVTAHMWLNIAALGGDREAARRRQEIASEMSKDQIAQALARARAWLDVRAREKSWSPPPSPPLRPRPLRTACPEPLPARLGRAGVRFVRKAPPALPLARHAKTPGRTPASWPRLARKLPAGPGPGPMTAY